MFFLFEGFPNAIIQLIQLIQLFQLIQLIQSIQLILLKPFLKAIKDLIG